jgi:epoxyqueuosine reductase QueG
MKEELEDFLKKFGAFKIGVADPKHGFKMAKDGCHPRNIMRNCNSVIAFAFHVGLDYYTTLNYYQKEDVESRILSIYGDWVSYKLVNFLKDKGYKALVPHGLKDEKDMIAPLSFKLAAYEAGLGVYGRPSILITPEYGPRVNLRVVLTNASIQPDKPLRDFNPCQKCDTCVRLCPVNAINGKMSPPKGFNRTRCLQFVLQIRDKTDKRVRYCGYCYNFCPVGAREEKTFNLSKWRSLANLNEREREKILQSLKINKRH